VIGVDAVEKRREAWTTEEVAACVVLPRTLEEMNKSKERVYLNLMEGEDVGREFQGTFVSQARECCFSDLVDALEAHFKEKILAGKPSSSAAATSTSASVEAKDENQGLLPKDWDKECFVWIDVFCANQALLLDLDEDGPKDMVTAWRNFVSEGLHQAMAKFDEAVIFLDRWNDPTPMQRTWCVWELYGMLVNDRPMKFIMTPQETEKFNAQLLEDADEVLAVMVNDWEFNETHCVKPIDKNIIDYAIEHLIEGGLEAFSDLIASQRSAWLLQFARESVLRSSRESDNKRTATLLDHLGYLLDSQGECDEAVECYERELKILQENFGPKHPHTATPLLNLADTQDQPEEALRLFSEALQIQRDGLGSRHLDVASTLNRIGELHRSQENFEGALAAFEEYLSILRAILGTQHVDVAAALDSVASIHESLGHFEAAMQLYQEALTIHRNLCDDPYPLISCSLSYVAGVHESLGNLDAALQCYQECLAITKEAVGDEDIFVSTTLSRVAGIYEAQKDHESAINYHLESLELTKQIMGSQSYLVGTKLHEIAVCYDSQGRPDDALRYYNRALKVQRDSDVDCRVELATTLVNASSVDFLQGRYNVALERLEEALELKKDVFGPDHVEVALILNNIASVYNMFEGFAEGLQVAQEAYAILHEDGSGERISDMADTLDNIAKAYKGLGRDEKAAKTFEKVLRMRKETLDPYNSLIANTLNNLALTYVSLGRFNEALRTYKEALDLRRSSLGDRHDRVGTIQHNMGTVYFQQEKWRDALLCFECAETIRLQTRGTQDPWTQNTQTWIKACRTHLRPDSAIPQVSLPEDDH